MNKGLQTKMKTLEKLAEMGVTCEDDLKKLSTDDLLDDEGISIDSLRHIRDIKKSVVGGKLLSYLLADYKKEQVI